MYKDFKQGYKDRNILKDTFSCISGQPIQEKQSKYLTSM